MLLMMDSGQGASTTTRTTTQCRDIQKMKPTDAHDNPLFLALLKPGVTSNSSIGRFSFGLTSGGMSINGSRSQDNIISFDGAVNMRTRSNGTSIGTADLETVQEIQVLTANYNAEYGRGMAGQIRFVTKSGASDFHGSVFTSTSETMPWMQTRGPGIGPIRSAKLKDSTSLAMCFQGLSYFRVSIEAATRCSGSGAKSG